MKTLSALIAIFLLAGCNTNQISGKKGESVIPDYIVGVWEADRLGWAFKIESDGSIRKLKHMLGGTMTAEEGGKSVEGEIEGTHATFILGECKATYDEEKKELDVKIAVDYYEMQLPQGRLQGRTEDFFTGTVSEDRKTFNANWRSYGWLDGADLPNKEEIENNPDKLIFKKLDLKI